MIDPYLGQVLMMEWASILFTYSRQSLDAAFRECGAPCFVAKIVELQLPAPLVDYMYGLQQGTAAALIEAAGYVIRGMQ